jgi:hypothetical protein
MRSNGPGDQSPLIRGLVYAWIGQNILLCISSILRLDLYVETYALTELRLVAGIWMILVAIGLGLILLRILLDRSNDWLVAMNLTTLAATLYLCSFVDFSAIIARFNVEHSRELTREGVDLDMLYLSQLGPTAIPALDLYIRSLANRLGFDTTNAARTRNNLAFDFEQRSHDWRSWYFRGARLDAYLQTHPPITMPVPRDDDERLYFHQDP